MSLESLMRAVVFDAAAPGADTDFITAITPKKNGAFRVTVILNGNSTLKVTATQSTTMTGLLNAGVALTGGNVYTFSFGVRPDTSYNFQLGSNVAIDYFQVDECYMGTV
jgi:hypothetical protein